MDIPKNYLYLGVGALVVIAVLFGYLSSKPHAYTDEELLGINLAEHKNLALHIHPEVRIQINGNDFAVPANIGITQSGMRVIHTHEPDNILHIEAPVPHQFYLADFFTIWGKRLTEQCIFEYCANDESELVFYVNGQRSALGPSIPFYDHDKIDIVYQKK